MPSTISPPNRHLFQSYAHDDHRDVHSLMDRLNHHLRACTTIRFEVWSDREILIGHDWDHSIKTALGKAHAGLLFLSPAAMASAYIHRTEIPALVGARKLLLVGLRPVDFHTQLPAALQALQVFRIKSASGDDLFYTQCRTRTQKDAFAHELYQALLSRLATV